MLSEMRHSFIFIHSSNLYIKFRSVEAFVDHSNAFIINSYLDTIHKSTFEIINTHPPLLRLYYFVYQSLIWSEKRILFFIQLNRWVNLLIHMGWHNGNLMKVEGMKASTGVHMKSQSPVLRMRMIELFLLFVKHMQTIVG